MEVEDVSKVFINAVPLNLCGLRVNRGGKDMTDIISGRPGGTYYHKTKK